MEGKEYIKGVITGVFLAVAGVLLGFVLYRKFNTEKYVMSDPAHQARLEVLEDMIDQYYLNETDDEKLADGVYHGLIYGLGDPYSRYYSPEEYAEEMTVSDGSYVGIGVVMESQRDGTVRIAEVYEGSSGEAAGIQVDDILLSVDGQDVKDLGLTELVAYIKSGEHESVEMTFEREGTGEIVLTVPVTDIEMPSVHSEMLADKTGYIDVDEFKGVTTEQFRQAYENLTAEGMSRLIVDLRDNPGGYVSTVCDILRMILPEGLIVYTEDKNGNREEESCSGDSPIEIPLAVLVNRNSASASEIFAGAVQDHSVGVIVGETTYGKGIVQSIRSFADGSAVKLTVSHYYTPLGHDIHEVGIRPDVPVSQDEAGDEEEDVYIRKALEAMESLENAA